MPVSGHRRRCHEPRYVPLPHGGRPGSLGTGALIAVNRVVGVIDMAASGLSPMSVLGLCAPWLLLLLPGAPWPAPEPTGWPATVFIGLGTLYQLSHDQFSATVLTGWITVGVLARRGLRPQLAVLLALMVTGVLLAWYSDHDIWSMVVANIIALAVSLGTALALRQADQRLTRSEQARTEALRSQRALIASELHDTLARANTQMILRAQQAQSQLHDPDRTEQVAAALEDIVTTGQQSVSDLRTMLRVLRHDEALPASTEVLAADLPTTLAQAEQDLRAAGLHAVITCEGDLARLSPSLSSTMARILAETVANMVKYAAHDARCTIQLEVDQDEVRLLVINPLKGARRGTPATSSGYGLISIQERALSHGGTATVTPTDHQWILHVTLPLSTKDLP